MDKVVIHCDLGEFRPIQRTFNTSFVGVRLRTTGDTSSVTLHQRVAESLHGWLPNLHADSIISIVDYDETDPDLIVIHVSVKQQFKWLRYGVQTKWGTAEELMSMLMPGDKIEMSGGTSGSLSGGLPIYNHLAIYTGKGCDGVPIDHDIVHFAPTDNVASKLAMDSKSSAGVRSDNLISCAKGRLCRINNGKDWLYKPRSGGEVIAHAKLLIEIGFGTYRLFTNNCEHLANDWRYGEPVSDQVDRLKEMAAGTGWTGMQLWMSTKLPQALHARLAIPLARVYLFGG